ncbi:somatomedin-B and thrombospondin type-1 domain-containing protein, partial [Diaphorina citri]|uniref:Somatomedin-B and thrombospondin type-1 domain-containing protein n=1 Tax=Diaphorina citri TaxID=121845 RepID=A0A3Q0IWP2_DIACI
SDCQVGSWEAWSECDTECGPGTMVRTRKAIQEPKNGGKHCPTLTQKRSCLGTRCPHNPRSALKGKFVLGTVGFLIFCLPSLFETLAINLLKRYYSQLVRLSASCQLRENLSRATGGKVCVRCESQAMRPNLGYRCPGHGTMDRSTRWSALSTPHCHGRWMRLQVESALRPGLVDNFISDVNTCPICEEGPAFIFV